ncbi:nucleoside-binding protein [Anaerolinea thermolimosa]|uniref:BMP family ABC transporter substrate-binding protein n=1 Tax=Anaerolinea thermolimosa TaxID=229919 RepID=UPI0007817038|nr:BMP family ABC transporter substrate-binding protein [Anaerolinea thermolimosa]GAP07821.1 nucleoside-binding protein [Anaerolinea thermolimosa]
MNRSVWTRSLALVVIAAFVLAACATPAATQQPKETPTPEQVGGFQIPEAQAGKFNVAMVLIGPHDDGGWSQAHYEGLEYIQKNVPNVHTAYIENVPEGADSEQVFRALSRKGFNLIFGTSFGFMDAMETVANEFPDIVYIHISGYKSNEKNFGNLFGGMETMKYLAGMLAGARAKMDGNTKLGYMATFPIPEELRLGNAIALGMRKTCPECTMDVRWINTWHDPVKEKEAAASLFDAGAQVVFTGADTPAVADVATEKGKWGVTYDWVGSCKAERCLTAPYWNWGPVYAKITQGVIDKTYKPGWDYFDADSGGLGLYGFMEGQTPTKGVSELPPEVVNEVKDLVAKALKGEFNRFSVFTGPIKDNTGKEIVPAGAHLEQIDLDQFPEMGSGCKYCMKWWAEGITAELPQTQ